MTTQEHPKQRGRLAAALREAGWVVAIAVLGLIFILLGIQHRFPKVNFLEGGGGEAGSGPKGALAPLAHLEHIYNEVRSKRADSVAWTQAAEGLSLYEQDGVQTREGARAIVRFDSDQKIQMEANALVIIKEIDRVENAEVSTVEIVKGSLHSQVGDRDGEKGMRVRTPSAIVDVNPDASQISEFRVDVLPDQTSHVMVYRGAATVTAQGTSVQLKENEGTQVGLSGPPKPPRPLLQPVMLDIPPDQANSTRHPDEALPLAFSWHPQEGAKSYHLQVARDSSFMQEVTEQDIAGARATYPNLKTGEYHWRVAAIDASGLKGNWSQVRTISVLQPSLRMIAPENDQTVNQETLWVEGESELETAVYLNGETVELDAQGRFRKELPLSVGENLVILESVDRSGVARFVKRTIHRKA